MVVSAALGNNIDDPAHRVFPINRRGPRDDLDTIDGFVGNEIEIHRIKIRLIHSLAIHKHGGIRDRQTIESAQINGLLKSIADTVVHDNPVRPLNGFLYSLRTRLPDVLGSDNGHFSGKRTSIDRLAGKPCTADNYFRSFNDIGLVGHGDILSPCG